MGSILLATSDMDGECNINISSCQRKDSLLFQGIGYLTRKICLEDMIDRPLIILTELNYELSEAIAQATPIEEILQTAARQLKKFKVPRTPLCRFYGNANYEKQALCKDIVVEYRREYGYYFTSGDIMPANIWDNTYRSYFVPRYMARSHNLTIDGQDTLSPSFLTTGGIRYDIGTRKIFTLIRAVLLYAPFSVKGNSMR